MTINNSNERIRFYMAKKESRDLLKRVPSISLINMLSLEEFNKIFPLALNAVRTCLAYGCEPVSSFKGDSNETAIWVKRILLNQKITENGYISLGATRDPVFAEVILNGSEGPESNLYCLWELDNSFIYYDLGLRQVIFFFVWEDELQFYCPKF